MLEQRMDQLGSLWQHISYVSVPAGGWQCREHRGDISAADFEQLVRRAVTNFVSHKQLSSVPTPGEIADSPRTFRYRFAAGAGYFVHAAQAGYDGSGRPNNVWSQVLKCADVRRMGAYPVEFWRSGSFFAPYGMQAVMEQKLDAEPAPVPGSLVTVANEADFIFSHDAETWRQGVLAVLLDAVFMRKVRGDRPIVLVTKSQDEAALWIGAVCRLADPNMVAELSFSLYERASQVVRVLSDGYDIVCVPYEDSGMLAVDNAVVIHTYKGCDLGDAETGKPHVAFGGVQVPVSAWSVAMFDRVASELDYADSVGLLSNPVSPPPSPLPTVQSFAQPFSEPAPAPVNFPRPVNIPAPINAPIPVNLPVPTNAPVPVNVPMPVNFPEPVSFPAPVNFPGPVNIPAPVNIPVPDNIPASQATKDDRLVESVFSQGQRDTIEKPGNIGDAVKALLDDYQGQEIPPKLVNLLQFLDDSVLSEVFAVSASGVSLRALALPITNRDKGNVPALPPVAVWASARILAEKLLLNKPIALSEGLQGYLEDFIEHYKFRAASNEPIAYDLFGAFYVFAVITDFFDSLSGNLEDAVLRSFGSDNEVLKTAVGYAREGSMRQSMLAWRKANLLSPEANSLFMHKIFALVVMFRNGVLDARAQDVLGASMFGTDMSLIRLCYLLLLEEELLSVLPANVESLVGSVEQIILRETRAAEISGFKFGMRDKILSLINDCRNYKPGGAANNSI